MDWHARTCSAANIIGSIFDIRVDSSLLIHALIQTKRIKTKHSLPTPQGNTESYTVPPSGCQWSTPLPWQCHPFSIISILLRILHLFAPPTDALHQSHNPPIRNSTTPPKSLLPRRNLFKPTRHPNSININIFPPQFTHKQHTSKPNNISRPSSNHTSEIITLHIRIPFRGICGGGDNWAGTPVRGGGGDFRDDPGESREKFEDDVS